MVGEGTPVWSKVISTTCFIAHYLCSVVGRKARTRSPLCLPTLHIPPLWNQLLPSNLTLPPSHHHPPSTTHLLPTPQTQQPTLTLPSFLEMMKSKTSMVWLYPLCM